MKYNKFDGTVLIKSEFPAEFADFRRKMHRKISACQRSLREAEKNSQFNLDAFMNAAEILSDKNNNLNEFSTSDGENLAMGAEFLFSYVKDKSKWPCEKDAVQWDKWPVRHPFLLFAGSAHDKPEYIKLRKTLEGYSETQEAIRNLPIGNLLLWLPDEPVNK